jgi:glutamine amidotransferase-like uncharacterized protein
MSDNRGKWKALMVRGKSEPRNSFQHPLLIHISRDEFPRIPMVSVAISNRSRATGCRREVTESSIAYAKNGDLMKPMLSIVACAILAVASTGCGNSNDCAVPLASATVPPVLLFNGTGTSPNDVAAIERVLCDLHIKYSTANSVQMNELGESRLRSYRLLIVPGGNYVTIGQSLTPSTAATIRESVHGGLNYLGICAGGIIAGDCAHNGLNLTSGVRFNFYSAVNRGIHKAVVPIAGADGSTLDQYWEDGPEFTGWGEIVGKYPDGTPAVVQGQARKGWVILCGVHPEAQANWRRGMNFTSTVGDDNAYAATLIRTAIDGVRLPHF